jgi:hypothetical protein
MGLDIYLYTKAQGLQNEAYTKEEADFYGEGWELYDEKTEAEREHFRNNRQFSYTHIQDVPARAYPGKSTLNNRRYLRSSYNGGEYDKWWTEEDIPGLLTAQKRAEKIAVDLMNLETPVDVLTVSGNMFSPPPNVTESEALAWAREQLQKAKEGPDDFFGGGGWQNGTGHFFGTGEALLEVVAAVPGQDYFGTPGVHLVYKADGALDSYIESATIVGEFAEEAVELIREDGSCYVSWSG